MNLADILRNSPLRQRLDERKWDPSRMSYDAYRMRDAPVIGKALQFYDDVTGPDAWSGSGPVFSNEDRQAIDNTPKAELMEGLGNYLPVMDSGGLAGMLKKMPIGDLAKGLDESLRMGRAKDMGFTVDAYHGTNQDIKTFDPLRRGDVTKARSANAFWFADNPDTASGYADLAGSKRVDDLIKESEKAERQGRWDDAHNLMAQAEKLDSVNMNSQNIVPVKLRGKFKDYDAEGKWMQDLEESALAEMLEVAKQEGFDGLQLRNFIDEAGYGVHRPATHTAVFNPSNIRSKFAKFDPKKSKSGDILAGAGAGFLASQLMGQDPNERF